MDKLKYDSLYKFIVSIGIAVIIAPFICLFGLLNNNEIVLVNQDNINQLTITAQEIITMEQNYKHLILSKPIIMIIIIVIDIAFGVTIVIYGIVQWRNKVQKYEDKSRALSNELLEKQIEMLTPEEKEIKVKNEMRMTEIYEKYDQSTNSVKEKQISIYQDIEKRVYDAIRKELKTHKVFENVKIGKEVYDCIALNNSNDFQDYIFEIKYFQDIETIRRNIEAIEGMLVRQSVCYYENTRRFCETVLIIIVEKFDEKHKLEYITAIKEMNEKNPFIDKIIITNIENIDNELKNLKKR